MRDRSIPREQIRAFAARAFAEADAEKRLYLAEQARRGGAQQGLALLEAMVEHAELVRAPFPSEAERREDLEHHIDLKRKLDRAAHVLSLR